MKKKAPFGQGQANTANLTQLQDKFPVKWSRNINLPTYCCTHLSCLLNALKDEAFQVKPPQV